MDDTQSIKFKCPKCGGEFAEMVEINAVVMSPIRKICPDGDFDYGKPSIDGSETDSYRCGVCELTITSEDGINIQTNQEFAQWCLDYCPQ